NPIFLNRTLSYMK
nr:Chain A, POLYCOMB PROTEIN SU(Z)12 [Drosophila melanogaster]